MYQGQSAYRAAWNQAYIDDPPVPLNVDIELVSFCNLACPFCAWGDSENFKPLMQELDWDGKPKRRFFDTALAKCLIDECAEIGVPALKMNFRGESTLHPAFSEIIEYARSKTTSRYYHRTSRPGQTAVHQNLIPAFHEILVNTNANCHPAAIDGLMQTTKLMISLDSMVEETYDQMRVGGNLGKALETIHEVLKRGHKNVWVRRVLTKQNVKEPFADNVRAMFGTEIHVSDHYAFDRSSKELMLEKKEDWGRQYCGYPSQRLVVTSSGKVMACCVAWRDETMVGYWPQQSILQIWEGQPIKNLRQELRDSAYANAPILCQNCTSYMSYKRKERDFVQDKEVA